MNERFKQIKEYIEKRDVLNIGCVDTIDPYLIDKYLDGWLHHNLVRHAKKVVGIDIHKEGVEHLKQMGYDARQANAENFELNERFDIIVAGEILEHLSDFKGFFKSVKKHLKKEGILILTTPNSFYFKGFLFLMLRGRPSVNPEHTCRFDEVILKQLLDRFNFETVEVIYTTERGYLKSNWKGIILRFIEKLIPFKKIKNGNIIIVARTKNCMSEQVRKHFKMTQ